MLASIYWRTRSRHISYRNYHICNYLYTSG